MRTRDPKMPRTPTGRRSVRAPLTDDVAKPFAYRSRGPGRHDRQLRQHAQIDGIRINVYAERAGVNAKPATTIALTRARYLRFLALCNGSHDTLTRVARECSREALRRDPRETWTAAVVAQMNRRLSGAEAEHRRALAAALGDNPSLADAAACALNNAYWEAVCAAPAEPATSVDNDEDEAPQPPRPRGFIARAAAVMRRRWPGTPTE